MLVATCRFVALMLEALSTGMAFAHLLEMPPRMEWSPHLWIEATVTGNVFRLFGSVGAVIETSAWIAAVVLAFLLSKRRPSVFHLALAAGTLSLLAFVVWWAFVFPVNLQLAAWTPEAFPPDWPRWRAQWEWAHASRAVLLILGFAALALSLLADADRNAPAEMRDART